MKFNLPSFDTNEILDSLFDKVAESGLAQQIKEAVITELKEEIQPLISDYLKENQKILIDTATEHLLHIVHDALLERINREPR